MSDVERLDVDVAELVERGFSRPYEDRFNELALRHFELLYRTNRRYRDRCDRARLSPATVARWDEIPPIVLKPFRTVIASCASSPDPSDRRRAEELIDPRKPLHPLHRDRRSRAITAMANDLLAKRYLFPDVSEMEMLLLVPPPLMAPLMVMASGLARMKPRFGTPESRFLVSFRGLELRALVAALRRAEESGRPVAVVGATFVLDRFLDACRDQGIRFALPAGSRIVESGGFTARYTGCTKEELFAKCRSILGVPEPLCLNALWLCESSTVYFDNALRNAAARLPGGRCKEPPPWTRVTAVDPRTLRRVPPGTVGLLRLHDLTNRVMAFAVQTDKLGYETDGGFEVVGNWNRSFTAPDVDREPHHPGGRAVTALMEAAMRRQLANLGRIASATPGTAAGGD